MAHFILKIREPWLAGTAEAQRFNGRSMSEVTVKQLASTVGIPVERLLAQLNEAGIPAVGTDATLSEQEKLQLLRFLRSSHGKNRNEGGSAQARNREERSRAEGGASCEGARLAEARQASAEEPEAHESDLDANEGENDMTDTLFLNNSKEAINPNLYLNYREEHFPVSNYIQRIFFGSPGTGKSYTVDTKCLSKLGIKQYEEESGIYSFVDNREADLIKTVFHPEYTYGDFMGKLVPITKGGKVEYNYYPGHFMRALAQAYKNILNAHDKDPSKASHVALVIDEINRGNSSAIFGTVFQLLDRDTDGWSSYAINLTDIEHIGLLTAMGGEIITEKKEDASTIKYEEPHIKLPGVTVSSDQKLIQKKFSELPALFSSLPLGFLGAKSIKIPPNFSIIATMNTSDNSIYFMDSAFKRRWDWEFMDWQENSTIPRAQYGETKGFGRKSVLNEDEWKLFVTNLNLFFKKKHQYIRGIEDKQIGFYFIKERPVTEDKIINKIMFFVWDSVFQRDKKPLLDLINSLLKEQSLPEKKQDELVTFGDFCRLHNEFVNAILKLP